MNNVFQQFETSIQTHQPKVAIVLGSGLGEVVADIDPIARINFADIPGLPTPTVVGHSGQLTLGQWAGCDVLVSTGRIHFYEGHSWPDVTRLVQLFAQWGIGTLILTNAAGGLRPEFEPGTLMLIDGHAKILDANDWRCFGEVERSCYCAKLSAALQEFDPTLPTGTYIALTGPCYETAAEVRALTVMGLSAVGMSTAMEAEAAHAAGMNVVAISTITNKAAGITGEPLTHDEVSINAKKGIEQLRRLLHHLVSYASSSV